jgi:serine/threonine protein kinase
MFNFSKAKYDLDQRYELKETLGTQVFMIPGYSVVITLTHSGAFSEVKRAIQRKTGESYAIKVIDRHKCAGKENMIQSEISILKKVQHENIIQLYELFETETKIYLVMQL